MSMNYAGIEGDSASYNGARFALLPVPYDGTTSYQPGARWGPQAILHASTYLELYDEELGEETYLKGIYTAAPLECDVRGPEYMVAAVTAAVASYLEDGKIPVTMGGEHTITLGAVRAVKNIYGEFTVLYLDAHADMRDTYQQSKYSHACVGRRIWECCPVVQVGVRSMSKEEADFIKEKKISVFPADFVREHERWLDEILAKIVGDVYVSIDLDCLDPSIMPATGTPEPGGLMYQDVVKLLKKVANHFSIIGFDVVELSPIPGMVAPDFLAAKLMYRIMGYL